MANQNNYWPIFLASAMLGIISMLLLFFGLLRNSGIAFLILAAVLALTGFLLGAKMMKANLYVLVSTMVGLLVVIFHFLVRSAETVILFMVVVFSTGFILVLISWGKKATMIKEKRWAKEDKIRQGEELPTIQVVSTETDKIYRELEKIEEELKNLEREEKKRRAATKKKVSKKKPKKRKPKKKAKKKKASQ